MNENRHFQVRQVVRIIDCVSYSMNVNCGVSQGIVFGLLLFHIYINGLNNFKIVGKLSCFVDDNLVLKEDTNIDILYHLANKCINSIKTLLDNNFLT